MQYSDFEKKLQNCKNKKILLGFSGGADSCALFLILAYWHKKIPFDLCAVHFEHGLRGKESLDDANFCRRIAEKYEIPFRMISLNVPENMEKNETMEAAARRLRWESFRNMVNGCGDHEIHLAHHRDDLTENVLLRLFRGANSSGLSGLREYGMLYQIPVRRILLDFSRQEIEDFLTAHNFENFRTDKTNFDCSIGRNYLRNKLLRDIEKRFPYALKGIIQSAAACRDDADFIEQTAMKEYEKIASAEIIPNDFWSSLHQALLVRVIRLYFSEKLGADYVPDKNFIQRFRQSLDNCNSAFQHKLELNDEYFYIRIDNFWRLEKQHPPVLPTVIWDPRSTQEAIFGNFKYSACPVDDMTSQKGKFYFAAEDLSIPLKITSRYDGETFEKFGGTHSSVKEELTNLKIRGSERDRIGILRNGNGEIMLIGDFRRSSFAPIRSNFQKIIEISVEKLKN